MSDSFADLWSSSAAIPPKAKPQTLASASIYSSTSKSISKPDAFSFLANPKQQQHQSRYNSPNPTSGNIGKRSTTSTPPILPPPRGAPSGGMDAFSGLFPSSNGNGKFHSGMTIAERLAIEAQAKGARRVGVEPQSRTNCSQDNAWVGLDSLVQPGALLSSGQSGSFTSSDNSHPEDDWGLSDFRSLPATSAATSTMARLPLSQPKPLQSSLKPSSLWDLEDFASSSSSAHPSRPSSQTKSRQQSRPNSTENVTSSSLNFDFTSQGDTDGVRNEGRAGSRLLDVDNDAAYFDFRVGEQKEGQVDQDFATISDRGMGDDDDILGMLSQPVEVVKAQTQTQKLSPSPNFSRQPSFDDHLPGTSRRSRPQSASSSPPPHILGQIVEMGFSVKQAQKALANTKDGKDIQVALEMLLGGSGGTEARPESDERIVDAAQEIQHPTSKGPPKGFRERERERLARLRRERDREHDSSTPPGADVVSDMQEHADRLLSQASEIGLSVLSKASTFWKEGKERVVKVYEERATTTTTTGQKERADGRPKWMKDGGVGSSRDDEVEDVGHLKAKERRISKPYQEPVQQVRRQDKSTELKSELNFSGTGLSEPARRRTPNREIPAPSSQVAVTETATPPFTLPTRDRLLPSAPSSSLSSVDKYRTTGSSQFKLGQYASAIDSYSAAIGSLPPGHLLLLPLFNNRALARMRTGEYKAAADDAAQALGIVLVNAGTSDEFDPHAKESAVQVTMSSWLPSMEPSFLLIAAQQRANNGGWAHPQGFGVDLADGYVKALHRRAEACEGRERWSEALKLWEVLSASDPAWTKEHLRKEAQRSAARCRKMIADEASASKVGEEAPKPKQRPPATKPATISAAASAPSAALRSLQASNAEAEAEDNLKHELKDSVDSKLALWRTGKETNIRALLASLDMVLWEELLKGTRVVGLHELVTPVQVKKGYIKAIARVHPDKLNPQNSTVEQRMLANGVFGALSEAWITFQSSNGM